MNLTHLTTQRRETLRSAFLSSIDCLDHCRAADIPDGFIDDYVVLRWLEWRGGWLRVTAAGQGICKELSLSRAAAAALES